MRNPFGSTALGGFAGFVWRIVTARATPAVCAGFVAVGALLGVDAAPGHHPAQGPMVQLAVALLCASALGRLWRWPAPARRAGALWAAGIVVCAFGALLAGGDAGVVRVGEQAVTEAYDRAEGSRDLPIHLGAELRAEVGADGVDLWLGVANRPPLTQRIPLEGVEERPLGQWSIHPIEVSSGDAPAVARLRLAPRAGGDAVEVALRIGGTHALPDGTTVRVDDLTRDYGAALGAAAMITLEHPERGNRTAWSFIDAPDLDKRVGTGPWVVEPLAIEAAPRVVLGVRHAGLPWVAAGGWILVALGVLLWGVGSRVEPRPRRVRETS
jgi:hypothetical protein